MQDFQTITGIIRWRLDGRGFQDCRNRYKVGNSVIQDIMDKYQKYGRSLEELMKMTPDEVEKLFYSSTALRHRKIEIPDFDELLEQAKIPGRQVSGRDLWEIYHQKEPDGYQKTQFFEYYRRYREKRFGPDDVTMRINRIPGERVFIDYSGDHAMIHVMDCSEDPTDLTEQQEIHLFLTTCGFSSKLYAEASLDEKQEQFNSATAHALEYYGAIPKYLVPDNLKTGVTINTKDKVVINASYEDLESFYETVVLPPPYRKPRGKATVERYVQVIEKTVIDKLQKKYCFKDMEDVNRTVITEIEKENNRIPKGYRQSHNELFEMYDKPMMRPLKDGNFMACDYHYCSKVPADYHVPYDGHFYSVPYRYYQEEIIIKATREEIILCDRNNREITRHKRCYIPTIRFITKPEHMPANHRFYQEVNERNSDDYMKWAEQMGPNMKQMICKILKSARHEEQMYNAVNGILHMCDGVPKGICEEAAADCVKGNRCRYHDFQSTLSDLISNRKQSSITATLPELDQEDIRGRDYYK